MNKTDTKSIKVRKKRKNLREQLTLHAMTLPGALLLLVFVFLPILGLYIAFVEFVPPAPGSGWFFPGTQVLIPASPFFRALFDSRFVGFSMFADVFTLPEFGQAVWNTVFIAFLKIVFQTLAGIVLALLLNEIGLRFGSGRFFKKIFQSAYFVPFFISWVLLGAMVLEMFGRDGIATSVLEPFVRGINGILGRENRTFFSDPQWFRIIVITTDVWKVMGYQAIFFLAAITGVNMSLYEAAKVDGANYWKQCRHVTIPGIMPIIILVSVLNMGNIMNAGFEQILVLANPLVYETGEILDTMAYRLVFGGGAAGSNDRWALSTIVGLFRSLVACIVFIGSYTVAAKKLKYNIL